MLSVVALDRPASAICLGCGEAHQSAEGFQHLAIDLIILDQDAETLLEFGKHSGHCHRIQFRQGAEQWGLATKGGDPLLAQAKHVPKHRAYCGIDLDNIIRKHS